MINNYIIILFAFMVLTVTVTVISFNPLELVMNALGSPDAPLTPLQACNDDGICISKLRAIDLCEGLLQCMQDLAPEELCLNDPLCSLTPCVPEGYILILSSCVMEYMSTNRTGTIFGILFVLWGVTGMAIKADMFSIEELSSVQQEPPDVTEVVLSLMNGIASMYGLRRPHPRNIRQIVCNTVNFIQICITLVFIGCVVCSCPFASELKVYMGCFSAMLLLQ